MTNVNPNQSSLETSKCPSSQHIPALDGLRGIAILLVMSHHFNILAAGSPVERFLTITLRTGWVGVDLFFVLSGYLITGILLDSRNHVRYFRNFYIRRSLRIFPLYYSVVLVTFFILPLIPGPLARNLSHTEGGIGWYLFYLSNVAMSHGNHFGYGLLNVTWSLAVEEQFYLVWPLVVYVLPQRRLMSLCLVLTVAAPILRVWVVSQSWSWIAAYTLPFCRVDSLAIGAMVAISLRSEFLRHRVEKIARCILVLSVFGLMVTVMMNPNTHPASSTWMRTLGFSCWGGLFGAVLTLILTSSRWQPISSGLSLSPLVVFGKYSYGLYLIHVPVRNLLVHCVPQITSNPSLFGQVAFWAVSTSLSLLLAMAVWYLIERPFLKLKDHFPSTSPADHVEEDSHGFLQADKC